jgi:predicted RNase H-like HicB family nuclease
VLPARFVCRLAEKGLKSKR